MKENLSETSETREEPAKKQTNMNDVFVEHRNENEKEKLEILRFAESRLVCLHWRVRQMPIKLRMWDCTVRRPVCSVPTIYDFISTFDLLHGRHSFGWFGYSMSVRSLPFAAAINWAEPLVATCIIMNNVGNGRRCGRDRPFDSARHFFQVLAIAT